jgi:hypothetical protein
MTKVVTQFEKDLDAPLMINQSKSSRGFYNLVVSIRDCGLNCKGIKAHRNWRISDVKWYFGVKGNKQAVYDQLVALRDKHFPKK